MGIASWILAGALAVALSRLVRAGTRRWLFELLVALPVAAVAGLVATRLDFGGWGVIDIRSFLFAFFTSLAAVPLLRLLSLQRPTPSR